jgi:hypothetical protein
MHSYSPKVLLCALVGSARYCEGLPRQNGWGGDHQGDTRVEPQSQSPRSTINPLSHPRTLPLARHLRRSRPAKISQDGHSDTLALLTQEEALRIVDSHYPIRRQLNPHRLRRRNSLRRQGIDA